MSEQALGIGFTPVPRSGSGEFDGVLRGFDVVSPRRQRHNGNPTELRSPVSAAVSRQGQPAKTYRVQPRSLEPGAAPAEFRLFRARASRRVPRRVARWYSRLELAVPY